MKTYMQPATSVAEVLLNSFLCASGDTPTPTGAPINIGGSGAVSGARAPERVGGRYV